MKKECKQNRGITLIALIITIIILLILVGVSINLAIKGDLLGSAQKAVSGTNAKVSEQQTRVDELMGELDRLEEQPGTTDDEEPAFKIEGKAYKVEKDMTWAQWIESEYNTDKYRIEGNTTNGVVLKNDSIDTIKYCPKATQIALAKDTIIVGQDYTLSTIKLPVYWYLSEAGEYVGATSETDLVTALDSGKVQLVHCELNVYETVAQYRIPHSYHGSAPEVGTTLPKVQSVEGNLNSNEKLICTAQIATPYYKYGEQMIAFNDNDSTLTMQELLAKMGIDTSKEIETNTGNVIKINECEALSPLFEIYLTNSQNDRKYDLNGTKTISLTCESAKEQNQDNLLILCIEEGSDKICFIELQDFDTRTGEMTIELPKLGVMGVLHRKTE